MKCIGSKRTVAASRKTWSASYGSAYNMSWAQKNGRTMIICFLMLGQNLMSLLIPTPVTAQHRPWSRGWLCCTTAISCHNKQRQAEASINSTDMQPNITVTCQVPCWIGLSPLVKMVVSVKLPKYHLENYMKLELSLRQEQAHVYLDIVDGWKAFE